MRFNICAAREGSYQTVHITCASSTGFFGMFQAATLCGLSVKKIFKGIDKCNATCWRCQQRMGAIERDLERINDAKRKLRVFISTR